MSDQIRAFIAANEAQLKAKEQRIALSHAAPRLA
jgi:hypothetical protein